MQEAFVAALLALARQRAGDGNEDKGGTDQSIRRLALRLKRQGQVSKGSDDEDWLNVCTSEADEDLDNLELWVEIKKQVDILREGMEKEN